MAVTDGTKEAEGVKTSPLQQGTSKVTYTEEQVVERERKARSDVLAEAGRYKAEAEKASKAAQASLDRINKMEQERIDAELEANRDDPAEIRRIRAEQKANQLEADLAKERESRTEYENRVKAMETEKAELTKTTISGEIAKKFNVDAEKLATLAKLTDGSDKAIEVLAEAMPRISSQSFKPDRNRSVGGILTWEQVRSDYTKDPYNSVFRQRYLEMRGENSVVGK